MLPGPPNAMDSVYVIWRFRHSTKPPPPANWAFMHQQDDLVRCPDPPKKCEFVNQYATALFRSELAKVNLAPQLDDADRQLIGLRQLHTLYIQHVSREFDGIFQCYVLINVEAIENRVSLQVLSKLMFAVSQIMLR
ncbi:hypothetical protein AHF37_10987 [Paragonimus kellicotti]|nr:hypothetical protein AHF37_10987 [Paragonimus kellicotti]